MCHLDFDLDLVSLFCTAGVGRIYLAIHISCNTLYIDLLIGLVMFAIPMRNRWDPLSSLCYISYSWLSIYITHLTQPLSPTPSLFSLSRSHSLLQTENLDGAFLVPDIKLHSNPSAFNVYCNVRRCVLDWQQKETSLALASRNSVQSGDSDSEEEEEYREPAVKLPKVRGSQ